jgi:ABC-type transport system substrate-binding protein
MKIEIKYNDLRFLNHVKYLDGIPNLLDGYKEKFGEAEELIFHLEEQIGNSSTQSEPFTFSEDGKKITIKIREKQYFKNGKVSNSPTPAEVYRHINFVMNKAVTKYAETFMNDIE